MITYQYNAITPDGVKTRGVVQAADEFSAVEKIKATCPIVTKITPVSAKSGNLLQKDVGGKTIDAKALSVMCSQFSIILRSGVPISKCMDSQVYNTNTNKTGVFKNATSNDGKTQFYIADFDAVKGVLVRPTNSMTGYGQGTIKDGGSKAYLGYTGATVAKDKHIRVWINKTTSEITISWE